MARPHAVLLPLAAGRDPGSTVEPDEALLASAIDHGMHGLLWSWVRDQGVDCACRSTLAGAALVAQQRHRRFWDTLVTVRGIFDDIDIEVATAKGVTAEARWYAGAGERPCSDVDLLVAPDALTRADVVLDALDPHHPLRGEINGLVRSGVMQAVNVRVDGVPVDLHFDLLKLGISTRQSDVVWERTEPHPLPDGTTMRVPDAELSLIHLLLHLNKDSFACLLGYADIARILRHDQLDWSFIDRFLCGEGLEVLAYCSLTTVVERLGLPVPESARVRGPRARAWRAVWPERVTLLGSAGADRSRRQDLIPFLARGRLGDTLGWLRRIVFPPASTVALRYHDVRGPYPWRLARGRLRTARHRRAALSARSTPRTLTGETPTPLRAPATTASLLRRTIEARPLWIDVRGRSMGRSIPDGSKVRVEMAPRPRRSEVWAFCDSDGNIVVHRCRGEHSGAYRFQGDARIRADEPITSARLIGRVVQLEPHRAPFRWGALAGVLQRTPRVAIAALHRGLRMGNARGQR